MQSPLVILGKHSEFELFNILSVPFVCLSSCMGHICPCQPAACQKVNLSETVERLTAPYDIEHCAQYMCPAPAGGKE